MVGFKAGFGLPSAEAIVAIPVQNEAERITACLHALSSQTSVQPFETVLFVNNTVDNTVAIIQALRPILSIKVTVIEHDFPLELQAAGYARRAAMAAAAVRAGPDAALLCTDADGQVAPDWLAANLFHMRAGAEAVAGRAEIDPVEAALIPNALHEADARECAYAAVLDEIDSLLDPDPADPWPRHTEHSGASICVTQEAFHRAGGVPAVPVGEDRAFFDALRRVDARIRHAMDVRVTVSGRLHGRAKGGMADTIRRRMERPDLFLDDRLEPAEAALRRSSLKRKVRLAFDRPDRLRQLLTGLGCRLAEIEMHCALNSFGALWASLQEGQSTLRRQPVAVADLPREMARARRLCDALRCWATVSDIRDIAA